MAPRAKTAEEKVAELQGLATMNALGCLISHLRPNAKGYIPVAIGGRGAPKLRAHRLVFKVKKGPIPEGLMVLHACDFRACINEDHLFLGTGQDNIADMLEKQRGANQHMRNYGRRP